MNAGTHMRTHVRLAPKALALLPKLHAHACTITINEHTRIAVRTGITEHALQLAVARHSSDVKRRLLGVVANRRLCASAQQLACHLFVALYRVRYTNDHVTTRSTHNLPAGCVQWRVAGVVARVDVTAASQHQPQQRRALQEGSHR
jgi:hypothetical protein